jgi:hypothetical protein
MQRRLQELLADWPEHPLLDQLQGICNRILSLPACGPLKAALTGVELLLSRAQTWEDGAAAHVSLSTQLAACAQLARRWRAAELSAWPRALAASSRSAAAVADATWFPLYRLMFSAPPPVEAEAAATWLRGIAAALEEFLRNAALGEYERRVELLLAFHAHAALDVGSGVAGAAPLAALLYNLHRYYFQFVADARAALDAARAPIQVKLKEHVKLAKWEVRSAAFGMRCLPASASVAAHLRTAAALLPPVRPKGLHTFARQFGWVSRACARAPNPVAKFQTSPTHANELWTQLTLPSAHHRTADTTRSASPASATSACCTACCAAGRRRSRAP